MSCGSPGHGVNQGDASKNFGSDIGYEIAFCMRELGFAQNLTGTYIVFLNIPYSTLMSWLEILLLG